MVYVTVLVVAIGYCCVFMYVAGRGNRENDSTAGTSPSPSDTPDSNSEEHQTTTTSQCGLCDSNAVYVPGDEFQDYSESGEIVDW